MGHSVFGVEEVDVTLFPPLFEPALSQTHLHMILRGPTSAFQILCKDHFLFTLLLIRKNYRLVQWDML